MKDGWLGPGLARETDALDRRMLGRKFVSNLAKFKIRFILWIGAYQIEAQLLPNLDYGRMLENRTTEDFRDTFGGIGGLVKAESTFVQPINDVNRIFSDERFHENTLRISVEDTMPPTLSESLPDRMDAIITLKSVLKG